MEAVGVEPTHWGLNPLRVTRYRPHVRGPRQTRTGIPELSRQVLCPFELVGRRAGLTMRKWQSSYQP